MTEALPPLGHLQTRPVVARNIWGELRDLIDYATDHNERSEQSWIGPSGLGNTCDRCLIHMINEQREDRPPGSSWLTYVGRCVHTGLQELMVEQNRDRLRWLVEARVDVGELAGRPVLGNADLFDLDTGTVLDWKVVGKTTLDKVSRKRDPGPVYRVQGHSYGRGFTRRGLKVTQVTTMFLPRNAVTLDSAIPWTEPYDEGIALAALERADRFANFIKLVGADQVLAHAPAHTGEEYSCGRYPNPDGSYSPVPGHVSPEQAFADILP